jgi:NADH-quinone oxidoreductase subunit L
MSVIHALSGEQNLWKMGGLKPHLPRTHWTVLAATLAIAGVFPFSGFFSKDEILWNAWLHGGPVLWGAGVVGAFLTAFYMFRLYFLTFHGPSRVTEEAKHHLHESPNSMTVPLMVLLILSVIGGLVQVPLLVGAALGRFSGAHRGRGAIRGVGDPRRRRHAEVALGHLARGGAERNLRSTVSTWPIPVFRAG